MPTYGSITFTATWDELHPSEQTPLEPIDVIDFTKPMPASWKVFAKPVKPDPIPPPLIHPTTTPAAWVFLDTPTPLFGAMEIFNHLSVETIATMERVLSDLVTYPNGRTPRVIQVTDAGGWMWSTCPLGIPMVLDGTNIGDYVVSQTVMPHGGLFAIWAVKGDHTDLSSLELRALASAFITAWDGRMIDREQLATSLQSRLAVLRA